MQFPGHCFRAEDQLLPDLILLKLPYNKLGRRPLTYPDGIARDSGILFENLKTVMADCFSGKKVVKSIGHVGDKTHPSLQCTVATEL